MHIAYFSRGKTREKNEDAFGYNDSTFVVVDGVTDKSGKRYGRKTGGEIIAHTLVARCLATKKVGMALVNDCHATVRALYKKINRQALHDAAYRFAATFVCARIVGSTVVVTRVGDAGFRFNGKKVYREDFIADRLYAHLRAAYITATGDVQGSRAFIFPLIRQQYRYQNITKSPLGFGVIDGTKTPQKFVRVFRFPLRTVKTVELFTDGYFTVPRRAIIAAWEAAHRQVERQDPYKYRRYVSTKSRDDRTVMIITFV